jgi:hypothetical protein
MTTTPPDDAAALFDLPPMPAASPSAGSSAEDIAAAEAAQAAELALAIETGDMAADAPDARTDLRVKVSWPARMQLPEGRFIELRVRDVSEGGVGLTSDEPIPARTVVNFEMSVPPLDAAGAVTAVQGTIKTTYTVAHGAEIRCGASWVQGPPAGLALVKRWIGRLRA